ncbi:unnamed protein product, partial [Prorocentrum cordatum]
MGPAAAAVEPRGAAKDARLALAGPLLAALAAVIPRDAEGLHGLFLVCTLLLLSAVLFAAECAQVHVPFLSRAARLVLDRTENARRNWETDTLRSFAEAASWLSISAQLHEHYGDVWVSAPLGALCGFAVVIVGDQLNILTARACRCGRRAGGQPGRLDALDARELAVFAVALAAAVGVRTSAPALGLGMALLEPMAASVCLVVMSQVLLRCSPGSRAGLIVHDRIVNTVGNWQKHPIRSALECSAWLATTYAVHSRSSGLLPLSAVIGGLAGFAVSIVGELGFSHVDGPVRPVNDDPRLVYRE